MSNIEKLSSSSSLKDLVDRQELLTNNIEEQKNTLKSILESKNVEVSEGENKLSILIQKVNDLYDYYPSTLYLYKEGKEFIDRTGEWVEVKDPRSIVTFTKSPSLKIINNTQGGSGSEWIAFVFSDSKVDMSRYSKLCFEVEEYYSGTYTSGNYNYNLIVSNVKSIEPPTTQVLSKIEDKTVGIKTMDISNINSGYIGFRAYCFGSTISIKNIWLEK